MKRRSYLWTAVGLLCLASILLLAWAGQAGAQSLPPGQGARSAAGQAAPETSLLPVWEDPGVYDTDPNGIVPAGSSLTFTFPVNVAGDVEIENGVGGVIVLFDCRPDTQCDPYSGTTVRVEASQSHPITVQFPHGGSWWLQGSRGDPATTLADLTCQMWSDGCSSQGCSDAVDVFVARWILQGSGWRVDVQVSGDPAATVLRGGPRYDMTAAERIRAGLALDYCVQSPPGVSKVFLPLVSTREEDQCQAGYILATNARGTWRLPLDSAEVLSIGHLPWTSPTTFEVVGEVGPVRWIKYAPSPYQNVVGSSFTYPGGHPGAEFSLYWFGRCGQAHLLDNIDP